MKHLTPLAAGAQLGLLGNGQLGRMFTQSAHKLGYRVGCWGPGVETPCAELADVYYASDWNDEFTAESFLSQHPVITTELEQVPKQLLDKLAEHSTLRPAADVVKVCQNRALEKTWLKTHGFPVPPFQVVHSSRELNKALHEIGFPCVVKTASGGYDGKGQIQLSHYENAEAIWQQMGAHELIIEAWVPHIKELSVVCARDGFGNTRTFPVCENIHSRHILAMTVFPARITDKQAQRASALAQQIAQAIRVHGLITVELFLLADGNILVNELAPRPHNSGHVTIETCEHSQFDFQVLTTAGHPLPQVREKSAGIMVNLLGDLWSEGLPDLSILEKIAPAHIHLYGKKTASPRRKMGHVTYLTENPEKLAQKLENFATSQNWAYFY